MSEQENETPVWHAWVGDGWEPVLFGGITRESDEVLLARGWANGSDSGGCIYNPSMRPRRRRKVQRFAICTTDIIHGSIGDEYCKVYASAIASPGDLLEVQADGTLKRVDIEAERQVER